MLSRHILKRMAKEDRNMVRDGGILIGLLTGGIAYVHYRAFIRKQFLTSEGHYRLNSKITNMTPWRQMYYTWYRMPEEEFEVFHKFKPYYVLGQLDYSKEILIPRKVNGIEGFDVINPLYCYEGGRLSFRRAFNSEDPVSIDRAAIIVNRGWIPYELKDRRSRPHEMNTRKLVKLTGCFRKGKDIHDYKKPNNPENNEWHNLALEDIGMFWDLPNFNESKYYYF